MWILKLIHCVLHSTIALRNQPHGNTKSLVAHKVSRKRLQTFRVGQNRWLPLVKEPHYSKVKGSYAADLLEEGH